MKKFFIFLVILAAIFVVVKLSIKSPDQSIPSATETEGINGTPESSSAQGAGTPQSDTAATPEQISADRITASFIGYRPANDEKGSVRAKTSTLTQTGGVFKGSVTFDMNTITSEPVKDMLITHLKGKDFFDVTTYPTATFTVTSATPTQVVGNLTMKGITKSLTLPITHDAATDTYSTTVRVNMEDFGIKQTFTDKEFVLTVTVK